MKKNIHNSQFSILLEGRDCIQYSGKITYICKEYIEINLDEKIKKDNFLATTYLHYFDLYNEIHQKSFENVSLIYVEKKEDEIIRFKFEKLTEEEEAFLIEFNYYQNQHPVSLHESNKKDIKFELALNLINPTLQNFVKKSGIRKAFELIKIKLNLHETIISRLDLKRVYIGHEYCERLLPEGNELIKLMEIAKEEDLQITFVLPNFYQSHIEKIQNILNTISEFSEKNNLVTEVVFNNWGTFEIIKNKVNLKPLLGKQLIKYKRDPRFSFEDNNVFSRFQDMFSTGDLQNDSYIEFLVNNNIHNAEIECLPQGIPNDLNRNSPIDLSIHLPFYNTAVSRLCLLGVTDRDPRTLWQYEKECKKACRKYKYVVDFIDPVQNRFSIRNKDTKSYIKGKALFSMIDNWKENFDFEKAYNNNVKRIVFYHEMPY